MFKHVVITVLLFTFFSLRAISQTSDQELLANAEHALLNYQNCEATEGNLRKVSAAGRTQPVFLLLKGKYAENCQKNTDSALHYYNLYLRKMPSDQQIQAAYNALIQKKNDEAKKRDCDLCKGTGFNDWPETCTSCNGKRYTGTETCSKCDGTGKRDCTFCEGGINSCRPCSGSGYNSNNYPCSNCSGRGGFYCSVCDGVGTRGQCHHCWGKGKKDVRCSRCEGVGSFNVRKKCTFHP
jgi:hypothetical protein